MLPAGPGLMLGLWRRDGVKPPASRGAGGEIAFTARNEAEVDALHAEWRARGVAIAQAPTSMDFGYTFVALDPDGQRLRSSRPALIGSILQAARRRPPRALRRARSRDIARQRTG